MSHPHNESLKIGLLCLIIILLTVFVYQNTQNNKLIQTALFPKVVTNANDPDAALGLFPKQIPNLPGTGDGLVATGGATYNASTNMVKNANGSSCPDFCVNQQTGVKITLTDGMACPAPYPTGMVYSSATKKCVKPTTR